MKEPATIGHLEPPYDHIRMYCTSEIERTHRLTAVSKEKETISFLESMPTGSTFWIAGANTGAYALIAASLGLDTFAFEPHLPTYRRLCENIALNPVQIRSWHAVLSDTSGEVALLPSSDEPGAALHRVGEGKGVLSYTVDDLAEFLDVPDYMLIDVDGFEREVLAGATKTLESVKAIQVEVDDSIPGHRDTIYVACADAGLMATHATRHGSSPISNVRFSR